VFAVGGVDGSSSKSVSMFDVSLQSPSWAPMVDMVVKRKELGVGGLYICSKSNQYFNYFILFVYIIS